MMAFELEICFAVGQREIYIALSMPTRGKMPGIASVLMIKNIIYKSVSI